MYLSFREPFLPLTPPQSLVELTVRCPPPSVRWHHRALPPRSPSTGSPGWTWSRRCLLLPGKRPWCAQFRYTCIKLLKRRRTKWIWPRFWRARLSRSLWKLSPTRKALPRRKRRHRGLFLLLKKKKVRLYFTPLVSCVFVPVIQNWSDSHHLYIFRSVLFLSKVSCKANFCCISSCKKRAENISCFSHISAQRKTC